MPLERHFIEAIHWFDIYTQTEKRSLYHR